MGKKFHWHQRHYPECLQRARLRSRSLCSLALSCTRRTPPENFDLESFVGCASREVAGYYTHEVQGRAIDVEALPASTLRVQIQVQQVKPPPLTQLQRSVRALGAPLRGLIGHLPFSGGDQRSRARKRRSEERRVGKECRSRW